MHRVDIYMPDSSLDVASESMAKITGNAIDEQSFMRAKSLGGVTYYGESAVFTDGQFTTFKNMQFAPGSRWYEGDSKLRILVRQLRETNTGATGADWPISASEDHIAASPQGNWQDEHLWWDGWTTRDQPESLVQPEFSINTPSIKLINCIIHDFSNFFFGIGATSAELYGCIIYNIGWSADRGHGHSCYAQNEAGTTKLLKHNIMFNSFGWGIHAFSGGGGENVQDMDFIENTCFNAGALFGKKYHNILIGADNSVSSNIKLIGNMTYNATKGINFYGAGADNVTLEDNYCPDDKVGTYTAISESGNYWGPAIGNRQFLHANTYDFDLANLTIYNEAQADNIQVDVSAVFSIGDTVKAHNVQDYFVDIQTLTVAGDGTITVNMQAVNRTVATPVGWSAPATTFPDFGCFRLVRQ